MKKTKLLSVLLATALAVTSLSIAPDAEAAKKPKLSKKKTANVTVGKTIKIKVKNAKKKASVKWSVKNKKIAKITKKKSKGRSPYAKIMGRKNYRKRNVKFR